MSYEPRKQSKSDETTCEIDLISEFGSQSNAIEANGKRKACSQFFYDRISIERDCYDYGGMRKEHENEKRKLIEKSK